MSEKNKETKIVESTALKEKIHLVRGQKVMIDGDLAEIYGYETRYFNRQVKNNIEKFEGEDFMFQLTRVEFENLRCKNFTSTPGGRRYLPYAFTEQGIYMLMTVLKGELATKQSKALIRMFKQMKDFLVENSEFIDAKVFIQVAAQTTQNTRDIATLNNKISTLASKEDFKKVMDNFIDPNSYKHFLLMNGEKIEADLAYTTVYKSAKKSIYVIDNYIGLKTLELLRITKDNVEVMEDPVMGSEDFAYFGKHIPSFFFFVGVNDEQLENENMLHHPKLFWDEKYLITNMKTLSQLAVEFLNK